MLLRMVRTSCSASRKRADTCWRRVSSRTKSRDRPTQATISNTVKPPSTQALAYHLARILWVDCATFRING
ncbi:hypothetical protein D3C71_1683980 [compost metagenome]